MERSSAHLVIRGGIWVNAERPEPCEVEMEMQGRSRTATFRFMNAQGPPKVKDPWKFRWPVHEWLYVFNVADE